ncbi:MAG: DUF84 family protein [Bacilli bacterium]|nr:DUF84 family protein [Bacilli bacterium]
MPNVKIIVGSTNHVKVQAIANVFANYEVTGMEIDSKVSAQPMTDQETIKGAINRAIGAKRYGDIGIGLEGGVQQTMYGLLLVNYGALVDEEYNLYIAGGARILLPNDVAKEIYLGKELGDIMDQYCHKIGVKHDEGAVGVFTNNFVKRQEMFEHIGKLLYGQMLCKQNAVKLFEHGEVIK